MWEEDAKFMEMLKSMKHPSSSKIQEIMEFAMLHHSKFYKHIVAALEKYARKVSGAGKRIGVVYLVDAICRTSRRRHGAKDHYVPRFAKCLPALFELVLGERLEGEQQKRIHRIVDHWTKLKLFPPDVLQAVQQVLARLAPPQGASDLNGDGPAQDDGWDAGYGDGGGSEPDEGGGMPPMGSPPNKGQGQFPQGQAFPPMAPPHFQPPQPVFPPGAPQPLPPFPGMPPYLHGMPRVPPEGAPGGMPPMPGPPQGMARDASVSVGGVGSGPVAALPGSVPPAGTGAAMPAPAVVAPSGERVPAASGLSDEGQHPEDLDVDMELDEWSPPPMASQGDAPGGAFQGGAPPPPGPHHGGGPVQHFRGPLTPEQQHQLQRLQQGMGGSGGAGPGLPMQPPLPPQGCGPPPPIPPHLRGLVPDLGPHHRGPGDGPFMGGPMNPAFQGRPDLFPGAGIPHQQGHPLFPSLPGQGMPHQQGMPPPHLFNPPLVFPHPPHGPPHPMHPHMGHHLQGPPLPQGMLPPHMHAMGRPPGGPGVGGFGVQGMEEGRFGGDSQHQQPPVPPGPPPLPHHLLPPQQQGQQPQQQQGQQQQKQEAGFAGAQPSSPNSAARGASGGSSGDRAQQALLYNPLEVKAAEDKGPKDGGHVPGGKEEADAPKGATEGADTETDSSKQRRRRWD
eukprot:jgi/Mesvir1/29101/Mv18407-RA.1